MIFHDFQQDYIDHLNHLFSFIILVLCAMPWNAPTCAVAGFWLSERLNINNREKIWAIQSKIWNAGLF